METSVKTFNFGARGMVMGKVNQLQRTVAATFSVGDQ